LDICQFESGSGFPWKVSRNRASSAVATGRKVEEARRRNEREGAGMPREGREEGGVSVSVWAVMMVVEAGREMEGGRGGGGKGGSPWRGPWCCGAEERGTYRDA